MPRIKPGASASVFEYPNPKPLPQPIKMWEMEHELNKKGGGKPFLNTH